MKNKNKRN